MLRRTAYRSLQYRGNDNLSAKSLGYGRMQTGMITPYRHWQWRQQELWRNVHEAQFEHTRKLYKRQWFESYRVNADEYIYKYNITKATTLAGWEAEMHAQEAARRAKLSERSARIKLKAKHLDLLREHHERAFFRWYERASERLAAMNAIPYISRENIGAHIDRELQKYVVGKDGERSYPLNFVGQMPMLEDAEGNIAQVPAHYARNFFAERPTAAGSPGTSATIPEYRPPSADASLRALEEQLAGTVSAAAHPLFVDEFDSTDAALRAAAEELAEEGSAATQVGIDNAIAGAELSDEEAEIARRRYLDRGKAGSSARGPHWKVSGRASQTVVTPESSSRLSGSEVASSGIGEGAKKKKRRAPKTAGTTAATDAGAPTPSSGATPPSAAEQRRRLVADAVARHRRRQAGADAVSTASEAARDAFLHTNLAPADPSTEVKVGEVVTQVPRIRARLRLPEMEQIMAQHAVLAAQASGGSISQSMRGEVQNRSKQKDKAPKEE